MKIKKIISALALFSVTSIAFADQDVISYNNTQLDSTMRVTTGDYFSDYCATEIPMGADAWVAAGGGHKRFQWFAISYMCSNSFPCVADVYLGQHHDCTGELVGTVALTADGHVNVLSTEPGHELVGGDHAFTLNS